MRTAKGIALVALLIATGCEGPTGPQGEGGLRERLDLKVQLDNVGLKVYRARMASLST